MDAVVAHIAHTAQHNALWEELRSFCIAGSQLAQHCDQGVADQRVDLVEQEHQGQRIVLRPTGQNLDQRPVPARLCKHPGPEGFHVGVAQRGARLRSKFAEDRSHGRIDILACGLGQLDVEVERAILARLVQVVHQGQQVGRLAHLTRGVQDEILLLCNQAQDLVQVKALQRGHTIVVLAVDGAGRVEKAHSHLDVDR